ncbi:MAG: rod shape-determining protein, partial [Patescibacteria group bacterium]
DLISGLPKEIMVTDGQIREALAKSVKTIIENIKATLEITPPDLVADIYERGMVLTGGGALLKNLDKVISKITQIPVRVADDPLTCVARGTGLILEDLDNLKDLLIPSTNDV